MITGQSELYDLAAANMPAATVGAFVGGLVIAGGLIWAVRIGIRVRRGELPTPKPEEQPHLPASGAVHEEREMREPDEVPHALDESERLMPYNLHASGSKRSKNQTPPRWKPGSSGSFGSGGPGGH